MPLILIYIGHYIAPIIIPIHKRQKQSHVAAACLHKHISSHSQTNKAHLNRLVRFSSQTTTQIVGNKKTEIKFRELEINVILKTRFARRRLMMDGAKRRRRKNWIKREKSGKIINCREIWIKNTIRTHGSWTEIKENWRAKWLAESKVCYGSKVWLLAKFISCLEYVNNVSI